MRQNRIAPTHVLYPRALSTAGIDSMQSEGYNRAMHIACRNRMITSAKSVKLGVAFCLAVCTTMGAGRSAAQSNSSATPPQPGQITGHVLRADNNEPIPRATVSLNPMGGRGITVLPSPQSTRTDGTGSFTFTTVPPGNYTLAAQHSGYVNESFQRAISGFAPETITVSAGETVSKIDVR